MITHHHRVMETPRPFAVLRGHTECVNCVSFVAPALLVSGSVDGKLNAWNLETRRSHHTCFPHGENSILSTSPILHDGKVITAGRDGTIRILAFDEGDALKEIAQFRSGCHHFCNTVTDRNHWDRNTIISPYEDESSICIWDIRCKKSVHRLVSDTSSKDGMTNSLVYTTSWHFDDFARGTTAKNKLEILTDNSTTVHNFTDICSSSSHAIAFVGYESGNVSGYDLRSERWEKIM